MKSVIREVKFLVGVGVLCLGGCAPGARMAPPASTPATSGQPTHVVNLLTQELPPDAGREVRMMTVEYPPGGSSQPHRHPGAVFVYVLEGDVLCALDDGPITHYRAGENWTEKAGQLHRVSANASKTAPAKLLVFFITEPGKPVKEPAK